MKKLLPLLVFTFLFGKYFAQDWVELKTNPNANFYDIQKSFNDYWKDKDITVKGSGYKPFKRWECFVEKRVYPSGDLSLLGQNEANFKAFLDNNPASITSGKLTSSSQIASSTWTAIGPMGAMTGSATNGLPRKAGRDNFITFHPTTATTFWVGAPAGGLWKTTDSGTSWTTNTDNLTVTGCSDLAVDPSNTNIMYLATGDGDAGDTRSIGVLKSTDGGGTWAATGLTSALASNLLIRRLIIDPTNTQVLLAATNAGIFRTANGGTNWTQINSINAYDLEFKPGTSATVYAASNAAFFLSTNNGASFTAISSGIPTTGSNRLAIAVTSADPAYVYVLRSNTSSGFGGLYRSTSSGTTFTVMSTTPDVLANSCAGTSGSGQGWYDLAIASSPLNKDEVVVGGVNHWRSINGGTNWTNIGCWNSTVANPPYVHADVHDLEYTATGVLYSANDGGIYYHTGTSWTDITSTRNIAQIYRIGTSAISANKWITGHQDNGSNIYNGTTYNASYPGDGMDCFIDRTNDNNMFASTPNGGYVRSTNGGTSWSSATSGLTGGTYWVSPWKQDPSVAGTIYGSRNRLWKSTNLGVSWTMLGAIPGSGSQAVREFAIAPSNNQVIYVIHGSTGIYKTTDGGTSWAAFNTGLPISSAQAEYISIDPTDPNNAWVVFSGYSAGNKVFMTTNGGTGWTNVSTNLPNLPANCIVYQPGTSDRIYVGMDVGVYYKDNSTTNWTLYNTGLPNTPIADMEISPASPTKLRAATYGRSVYEVDVISNAVPPVSAYTYSGSPCTNLAKTFNDISTNAPTSWSWSVTPSTGVTINTSASQNPTITFANAGTYTVSMIASNSFGAGNTSTQTVSVIATPTVAVSASVQTICSGTSATITASGATTYSWNTGSTASNYVVSPLSTTVYSVTGFNGTCVSSVKTSTVNVNTTPVVIVNNAAICNGGSATITASGATSYSWNTGATSAALVVSPGVTTVYTVTGTTGGCSNIKTSTVSVNTTPTIVVSVNSQTVCSGTSVNITATGATTYSWSNGSSAAAISINPASTTVYSVTGYNGSCPSTPKTSTVVVNASPTVNVGSATVCSGNSVSLTASGATTYSWNTGATSANISVSPSSTTIYTVTGTTGNCTNVKTSTVTVAPLPVVTISASNTFICVGQSVALTGSGASSYTWNPGSVTGATVNFTPAANTVYTATGMSSAGCFGNNSISITVSACTGIFNGNFVLGFDVYPNPANDMININIVSERSFDCKVEICDALGKLVLKQNASFSKEKHEQQFNISSFAKGIYFLRLTSKEGNSEVIKVVKD